MRTIDKILDYLYYTPKRFLTNFWIYRKFLTENFWWDNHYIFFMLREKIKNDLDNYKKYSCNAYPESIINSLGICVMLLNRIVNDDYFTNALYFYDKKHSDYLFMDINNISDYKWFRRCSRRADLQKQQDIDYLFKLMSKHIQTWWD